MTLVYAKKLGFWIQKTDVNAQKIDDIILVIHGMVIANFSLQDKYNWDRFFEKTFLVIDTSMKIVFGMLFFSLFDINIRFVERNLEWRRYTTTKTLSIKKRVKLINYKEFAVIALDSKEAIIIYITLLEV